MTTPLTNQAVTVNGAVTHATTESACLDLFFCIGGSRALSPRDIAKAFAAAWSESPESASRIALWARDVRSGAGERRAFRNMLETLILLDPDRARRVMALIPELGRWDDVLVAIGTPLESTATDLIQAGLHRGDRLCAKWLPRKGDLAARLRKALGYSPKQWRKTLVGLTNVVETEMCENRWDSIDFGKVPSQAHSRYMSAFRRHAPVEYSVYLANLSKGTAKINAGAIFPHDIVVRLLKNLYTQDIADACDAQWRSLPNLLHGYNSNILPVVDVSGSMRSTVSGEVTALDIAVSLGLYIAERNEGLFRDHFVTFSENPEVVAIQGVTLRDRLNSLSNANWGYSTNFEQTFKEILNAAIEANLPEDQMPSTVLVLSDMQFNLAGPCTNFDAVDAAYQQAGYRRPKMIFWNIVGAGGNYPVQAGEADTALVSGFSPHVLKMVLSNTANPTDAMNATIYQTRYDH
jgi:hypothetical protein